MPGFKPRSLYMRGENGHTLVHSKDPTNALRLLQAQCYLLIHFSIPKNLQQLAVASAISVYVPGPQWVPWPSGFEMTPFPNSPPPVTTCFAMKMLLAPGGLPVPITMAPAPPLELASRSVPMWSLPPSTLHPLRTRASPPLAPPQTSQPRV